MDKIKCAIIGPGNIGMNLLFKIRKSRLLECTLVVGRNPESAGIKNAKKMGVGVSTNSLQALVEHERDFDIVFDATNAASHKAAAPILRKLNKFAIDLTPSKVGRLCIPCLNKDECLGEMNVNMVTCGGQSMVPIATAMRAVCPDIRYFEVISTIASASAGAGTRENIDDYVLTTRQALYQFSSVEKAKSMIVLNPADPPVVMKNTLYAMTDQVDLQSVTEAVSKMEGRINKYVPGFRVIVPPTMMEENIIAVTAQVEGTGDYLPKYAGNLDIITCAAVEMAEHYAIRLLEQGGIPF